ncbi:MAG: nitroreductase family protein, partial [Deltaproteobacteria bacterium]|nr:nitroreductase family protein [Deltaproteobacteria bacterium]
PYRLSPRRVELSRVIAARRSLRAYSDRPVEPQKLERLLEAARWAPSAGNRQPWRFVVVSREAPTRLAVEAALDAGNSWARRAPRDGRVFVEAESTQVAYDYRAGRPVPLPPELLAKLEPYVGG